MSTGTPKRVSFGSGQGSLVETLIIDDGVPNGPMATVEQNTSQHNSVDGGPATGNGKLESPLPSPARRQESPLRSPARSSLSSAPSSPARVEVKQEFMESHDNPFTQEGELSQKADFILKHSKISRTEIRISDPDGTAGGTAPEQIEMMEAQTSSPVHAAPPPSDVNGVSGEQTKLNDKTKVNGQAEADGAAEQPKDTKKKKGKAKCCVVQ